MISIHAPRMGSDGHAVPCAFQSPEISIHAPRMGSDPAPSRPAPTPRYFNPRSPDGERRIPACRPCRARYFNPRSPDGERPGSVSRLMQSKWNSNPRSPDGERLIRTCLAGFTPDISIHAPRMGSDAFEHIPAGSAAKFQSTLPGWGATAAKREAKDAQEFQSTLPGWGATVATGVDTIAYKDFNPRSPDGERRLTMRERDCGVTISIHAPRMGSDTYVWPFGWSMSLFQSTLPG